MQAAKKEDQTLREEMVQRAIKKEEGEYALNWAGRELGVGASMQSRHVKSFGFLVVRETYAAFVFDGTGWWDHAYWHDEGWYWGMRPSHIIFRHR